MEGSGRGREWAGVSGKSSRRSSSSRCRVTPDTSSLDGDASEGCNCNTKESFSLGEILVKYGRAQTHQSAKTMLKENYG